MDSSYGLVLAGGGAKGVYQIGAWRALLDLDIRIQRVVGTSVGAMNGALVVLNQYEGAVELWKSMSIERGFQLPEPLRVPDNLFSLKNADILAKELWHHHGLDISPLRRRLEELISEPRLRLSPTDFGLVTFELSTRQSLYLYKDQIPIGRLMDYIMASAAYPGLKRPEIDGKTYLDGGIVDSIPLMHARKDGYTRNVVVLTRNRGYRKDIQGTKVPSFIYKKYPHLREAINRRSHVYNEQLELVERLEDAGEITVIRPQKPIVVDRIERDVKKLTDLYEEGYACAAEFFL